MQRRSDTLRRQLQQQGLTRWQRLKASFRRYPDPFEGTQHLPLFTSYLQTLRPWDPKPSEHYLEVLRQRNYWYDHPPPLWLILSFLAISVVVNITIAFLPLLVNYEVFVLLWKDLQKPGYVYEGGLAAAFTWLMVHITSSFAPWFVYLTGGWVANRWYVAPYALMLAAETLLADLMFGAKRLDYTSFCCLACFSLCLCSVASLGSVTRLAGATLFPSLAVLGYLTVLCFDMWSLNGHLYLPAV